MKKILCFLSLFWLITVDGYSQSEDISNTGPSPVLAFSDLINGPASGLGDGLGEGAIVTVWGYHLGEKQGQVFFTDSTGKTRPAAHIYYWKKADGKLPGGPANLYKSHQLYEVAFSIPKTTLGPGKIDLRSDSGNSSNFLPFSVVSGRIFHIKTDGNNDNDGSFAEPWRFLNGDDYRVTSAGNGKLTAGDIVYFHGVTERLGEYSGKTKRAAIFLRNIKGRKDAHVAMVGYPGTQNLVESPTVGIYPYLSTGIVVSKFTVKGGVLENLQNHSSTVPPKSPSTAQIKTSAHGRIVANAVTDMDGRCSNGYAGAITGSQTDIDNLSILGNEIYEIGCKQTSHFHHTTYLTRRSQTGAAPISAGEFAWNHLRDNMAKYGIHYYDQANTKNSPCDQVTGNLRIHNNYIINQRSVGISVRTAKSTLFTPCWQLDTSIYNNVIINSGLGPIAEISNGTQPYALFLGGGIAGSFKVFNNLIISVSDLESRKYEAPAVVKYLAHKDMTQLVFKNNIIQLNTKIELISGDKSTNQANIVKIKDETSFLKRIIRHLPFQSEQQLHSDEKMHSENIIDITRKIKPLGKGIYSSDIKYDFYGNEYIKSAFPVGPLQISIENDDIEENKK